MLTLRYNSYIVFHLILAPCWWFLWWGGERGGVYGERQLCGTKTGWHRQRWAAAFCRNLIFVPTYALFKLFWTGAASVSWIPGSNFGRAVWYLEAQLKFLFWPRGNLICKIYCLKWLFFSGWLHKMHYWMLTKSFHFNAAREEKLYWLHRQE